MDMKAKGKRYVR